jgi:hypothetical protein
MQPQGHVQVSKYVLVYATQHNQHYNLLNVHRMYTQAVPYVAFLWDIVVRLHALLRSNMISAHCIQFSLDVVHASMVHSAPLRLAAPQLAHL